MKPLLPSIKDHIFTSGIFYASSPACLQIYLEVKDYEDKKGREFPYERFVEFSVY